MFVPLFALFWISKFFEMLVICKADRWLEVSQASSSVHYLDALPDSHKNHRKKQAVVIGEFFQWYFSSKVTDLGLQHSTQAWA